MFRVGDCCLVAFLCFALAAVAAADPLSICTFQSDATPPLGSPLCQGGVQPAQEIVDPLTVRGVVLLPGDDKPIVLCAVDWVGIGNGGYDLFRQTLADAAGTSVDRVALHTLHQHDAPGFDTDAEALLAAQSKSGLLYHVAFAQRAIDRAAAALTKSLKHPQVVTHLGTGAAEVEKVASNRRILGDDGKVKYVRYSASRIEEAVAAPEGVIDPLVRVVSFWNDDQPLAVMSYYATHPQSYYGQGGVSWDFVGMARAQREEAVPGVPHIHFNGAGGNVAAGKYNDGSPERRPELAGRLAAGMAKAWEATKRVPVDGSDVGWRTCDVRLPLRDILKEDELVEMLQDSSVPVKQRVRAARDLAFVRRARADRPIQLSCLTLPGTYIVHMPGELFVEYQLAAAKMQPDAMVCMAAYGDYGPGYIGTEIAYAQGGYETSYVSRTAPEVEGVLMDALRELLQ
ncbi:MAG: hypothetical protein DWQ37_14210 [Planctomycetota bacterium]|nr:MAG: hypothetical protein DWQ37_14210 [Planctomycetota bacterium]